MWALDKEEADAQLYRHVSNHELFMLCSLIAGNYSAAQIFTEAGSIIVPRARPRLLTAAGPRRLRHRRGSSPVA